MSQLKIYDNEMGGVNWCILNFNMYVFVFFFVYIILIHSFIKNRRHCHRHRDNASLVVFPNFMYKYFEDFLPFRNSSNYLVLLKRYFIVSSIVCIYNLFIQFLKYTVLYYEFLLFVAFHQQCFIVQTAAGQPVYYVYMSENFLRF